MNKQMIVVVAMVGLIAAGCTKQQEQTATVPTGEVSAQAKLQADAQALQAKAEAQAQEVAAQAQAAAKQAEAAANELVVKTQNLLSQAKQLMDQGKMQEAIAAAQQVLSFDPNNVDAKQIIETAKAKIAEMAQQAVGDVKTGIADKLGAFGK